MSIGASNNMFTGGINMDAGTLQTTGVASLGNAITLGAGGGTFDTGGDLDLTGIISGTGGLTKIGTAILTLSGANTYSGLTTITTGTLVLQDAAINNGSDIADNAHLIFDDSLGGTYGGDISGSGDVTKIGAATTTLTGLNTYTGATFINDGTLAVGGTGIGDISAVTVTAPASLQLPR